MKAPVPGQRLCQQGFLFLLQAFHFLKKTVRNQACPKAGVQPFPDM
jgi:hypothetical protein